MSDLRRCVVLGGRSGLLGRVLADALEADKWDVVRHGRTDCDVTDTESLRAFLEEHAPDMVFNSVAYTAVDKAEEEPEAAYALNKSLPASLGRLSRDLGFALVHYSTDFVFGEPGKTPHVEEDPVKPGCVYGQSKLAGEKALLSLDLPGLLIIRTAWLFGPGKGNFVRTMLNLAHECKDLRVVHDQIGSPTYTVDLARHTLDLVGAGAAGLYHLVNGGEASWCELASEAIRLAGMPCKVDAVSTAEFPRPAKRPSYSVLDTAAFTRATGVTPRPWAQALQDYVFLEIAAAENDT